MKAYKVTYDEIVQGKGIQHRYVYIHAKSAAKAKMIVYGMAKLYRISYSKLSARHAPEYDDMPLDDVCYCDICRRIFDE